MSILLIRVIVDWVLIFARSWRPRGIVAQLIRLLYTLTEPPLAWLRRYIPPIPLGAIRLDVGFIVLYAGLIILQALI